MMFRFSLAVWGDWHIDQFVRNALPSLKAPGNLDAIDYVIAVHTRPADVERLRAALEGVNAELLAPIADDTAGDQTTANVTIQGYAARDIQAAVAAGEVWGLLAPDMVWSEGTFALYRQLLEAGNRMVFRPLLRVDSEKAGTIREFGARHLAALALDHEHSVGGIYRADAERFTTHTETIIWPAPDGRLHQTISTDVVLCVANRTRITPQFLSAEQFVDGMAVVTDSDQSVALAMCQPEKHYEWQYGRGPLTPELVREFMKNYPSPALRGLASRPYRLHAGDLDPARWEEVERRAADFIDAVFEGVSAPAPPTPPADNPRFIGPPPAHHSPPPSPPPILYDRVREGIMRGTLMR